MEYCFLTVKKFLKGPVVFLAFFYLFAACGTDDFETDSLSKDTNWEENNKNSNSLNQGEAHPTDEELCLGLEGICDSGEDENGLPYNDEKGLPNSNEDEFPDNDDGSGLPDDDGSGLPDDDGSGLPDDDGSGLPDDDGSGLPDDDGSGLPDDDGSGLPDDDGSGLPDDDGSGLPDDDGSGLPDDDGSGLPDDDGSELPDDENDPEIVVEEIIIDQYQIEKPTVDILWVLDSSVSMVSEQENMMVQIQNLYNELSQLDVDYQMAVTSTDVCQNTIPSDKSMRRCPLYWGGSSETRLRGDFHGDTTKILTPHVADGWSTLENMLSVGTDGSRFEHGLTAIEMAVTKSLNAENEPLLRDNVYLSIIVVSDEEDAGVALGRVDSEIKINFVESGWTTYEYTDDDLISYLNSVKGIENYSVSAVTGVNEDGELCSSSVSEPIVEGAAYISVASKTGGDVQSLCDEEWSQQLIKKGIAERLQSIVLTKGPDESSIRVYIEGEETLGWSYDSDTKTLTFDVYPEYGAHLSVEYDHYPE